MYKESAIYVASMEGGYAEIEYSDIHFLNTIISIICGNLTSSYVTEITEYKHHDLLLDLKCHNRPLLYVPICAAANSLIAVAGVITLFLFWVSEMGICFCVQVQNQ